MLAWYRVSRALPMMLFFVVLPLHVLFTAGLVLMLATSVAFFRDTRHLLDVLLAVLFWTTPIVYDEERYDGIVPNDGIASG